MTGEIIIQQFCTFECLAGTNENINISCCQSDNCNGVKTVSSCFVSFKIYFCLFKKAD